MNNYPFFHIIISITRPAAFPIFKEKKKQMTYNRPNSPRFDFYHYFYHYCFARIVPLFLPAESVFPLWEGRVRFLPVIVRVRFSFVVVSLMLVIWLISHYLRREGVYNNDRRTHLRSACMASVYPSSTTTSPLDLRE